MLMLDRALKYAAAGWPVFPLAAGSKVPLIKAAHPPGHPCRGECGMLGHGLYDATVDVDLIAAWWGNDGEPGANLGLRTGVRFWVLDVDAKAPKRGGLTGPEMMAELEAKHGKLPETLTIRTPGGGLHMFFALPVDRTIGNRVTIKHADGRKSSLDVRGVGAYVVGEPSSVDGKSYALILRAPIVAAPGWLLDVVCPQKASTVTPSRAPVIDAGTRYGAAALAGACQDIQTAAEGERHARIFSASASIGSLIAGGAVGLHQGACEAALIDAARSTGKTEREIQRTVRDGLTKGAMEPRRPDVWESRPRTQESPHTFEGQTYEYFTAFDDPPDETPPPHGDEDAPHVNIDPSAAEWEPPIPLSDAPSVPQFPLASLPYTLRTFAAAVAESTQTPVDMAALFALGACSIVLARRVYGYAWWKEPVNLYQAVAMDPANRKSSVIAAAMAPILAVESEDRTRLAPEIRIATIRGDVYAARTKTAQAKAEKAKGEAEMETCIREAAECAAARDALVIPTPLRYIGDDVTPEKLVGLMAEQGERFAIVSAEGGPFDMMAGRYSDVPNLEIVLKGHAGDPVRVDRIGRASQAMNCPALSYCLAIQPDVVRGLADKPGFRGRGLLARFLFSIPQTRIGSREVDTKEVPETVRRDYDALVRGLIAMPLPAPAPSVLLSHPARERLVAFSKALEPRLGPGGDLNHMSDWAGKLAGAVLRIATIFHLIERVNVPNAWDERISVGTLDDAMKIGEYLTEHAQAAFGLMGADPTRIAAGHLLAWVKVKGGTEFRERDALRGCRRFHDLAALRAALAVLIEHGYVRRIAEPKQPKKRGKPQSILYSVNPS